MVCVIAKLPPDVVKRLNILRKAALSGEQPVPPLHGHITVAAYLPEDDSDFLQACSKIIPETPSFSVWYGKLEVLAETSIIVATPSKAPELMALHGRIAGKYSESLDRWTRGAGWYPHTTLIYNPHADLNGLCRNMQRHFVPFEARISRVELSRAGENGYSILKSIDLKR